jgi:hypothetical protein
VLVAAYIILPGAVLPQERHEPPSFLSRFSLHGYGVINYYGYSWDTDPARRNAIDLERLVLYPAVQISPAVSVRSEVEFEHGGTGATMEFDRFEEFGEFEAEIEKGGEVVLDQLHVQIELSRHVNFRVGRIKLPIGLIASHHEPTEYFTTTRSELEATLVPAPWYENGVEFYGSTGDNRVLTYHVLVVNGLDGTGFSSANWVLPGHQKRFETVNAENLAVVIGLEGRPVPSLMIGGSAYYGNTTDNRPKPDLSVPTHVGIVEAHGAWEWEGLAMRAMAFYGTLENADLLSAANRNLSNSLNVKRTPVGSVASGYFAEAGYNVLRLFSVDSAVLVPFLRWESYDSMAEVAGDVFDNPRWERDVITAGINFLPFDDLVFKAQYSQRRLGIPGENLERTFSLGIGFEFE